MASLYQIVRSAWLAVTTRETRKSEPAEPILHDPGAGRPHDLDDPFFDPNVQSRIGGAIAQSPTREKSGKSE